MSFVRTPDEISQRFRRETYDFSDAELLSVYWETKPEIIKRLLPPPLKPYKRPIVCAVVTNYPKTNFSLPYKEASLNLTAEFNGKLGYYCLSMPVTDDMAMATGREEFGFPKKMANIQLKREGKEARGWVERHGTRLFDATIKLTGKPNSLDALKIGTEMGLTNPNPVTSWYLFKYFPSPVPKGIFDYKPRFYREDIKLKLKITEMGEAEMALKSSNQDPWGEVEVQRVLLGAYVVGDVSMLKAEMLGEVEPDEFRPYSTLKWDPH